MARRKQGAHKPAGGPRERKAGGKRGSTNRRVRRHARPTRCRTSSRPRVHARRKSAWAAAWVRSSARPREPETRDKSHAEGIHGAAVLKAARCLHRRMPKRGFHNPFSVSYSVVDLEELNVFPAGETVTPELLRAHGFIRRAQGSHQSSRRRGIDRARLPFTRMLQRFRERKNCRGGRHVRSSGERVSGREVSRDKAEPYRTA